MVTEEALIACGVVLLVEGLNTLETAYVGAASLVIVTAPLASWVVPTPLALIESWLLEY
jgi:hypothetical protein